MSDRYLFIAADKQVAADLVGQAIQAMTPAFHYYIHSFGGKQGLATMHSGTTLSPLCLNDLPICFIDYVSSERWEIIDNQEAQEAREELKASGYSDTTIDTILEAFEQARPHSRY